ncbi:UNVERIFIED_CONTAM: hypothetical protein GTU68_055178 [Idotea baltica]|nr:hypothetical protein [Idotea baltica]
MPDIQFLPPPVTWAQRANVIFLTFCVEDCKSPDIKMESDKVFFKGVGGTEKKPYQNTLDLYKEIDPEKSRYFVRDRIIELILVKKEEGPYWPQLLKEKVKMHWLKVDFTKWKDENDSDEEGACVFQMMRQMGGLGMEGGENRPSLDDLDSEDDSDDDELPDLE